MCEAKHEGEENVPSEGLGKDVPGKLAIMKPGSGGSLIVGANKDH